MTITELIEKHANEMGYPQTRNEARLKQCAIELLELVSSEMRAPNYDAIDKALEELRK